MFSLDHPLMRILVETLVVIGKNTILSRKTWVQILALLPRYMTVDRTTQPLKFVFLLNLELSEIMH